MKSHPLTPQPGRAVRLCLLAASWLCGSAQAAYPTAPEITDRDVYGQLSLQLSDFITAPKSGTSSTAQVARINFVRQEPVASLAAQRLFIPDLNGNLHLYNRATNTFSTYLNFPSEFGSQFDASPGFAAGLVTLQFDPDYANNGKFYTVHTELGGNPSEYREAVLYEWRDTNINNTTFSGTRAELMRVRYQDNIHPVGDIIFNPLATDSSHPDWRNMYIASGDGAAGEQANTGTRSQNQMLNNLLGKVLRITPAATGTPGTYSIPSDNPFVGPQFAGARGEVYAYGFRNPHRLSWDVDPENPQNNYLFVSDIGLHSYEEINLVKPGANYGYSTLEGPQVLGTNNQVNNNPLPPTLPIYVNTTSSNVGSIVPTYPLTAYSHRDGDAVTSGFVYRGTKIPELYGKFVFGDISTGRLFYCELDELLAADDGDPNTEATIHEFRVLFASPYDDNGLLQRRVFDIVRDAFDMRNETSVGSVLHNGTDDDDILPGGATATTGDDPYGVPYGRGRADIRWVLIDNELYLLSKSDGMIREVSMPLAGDANLDGVVDHADLAALAGAWQTSATWKFGDFDHNGFVDISDLYLLAKNFEVGGDGMGLTEALASLGLPLVQVPEPGMLSGLVLAAAALARRGARGSNLRR